MTEKQLLWRVVSVVVILLSIFGFALICRFGFRSEDWYSSVKDFSSIFLGIGGAYLAYCFQRRQSFISSLKDLWKEMVLSHLVVLKFIDKADRDVTDYHSTYEQISETIDLVRSVYPNVGEDNLNVGLYPFQPLRDMLHAVKRLHPNDPQSFAVDEREKVESAWNALRWSFLPEFSRPPATKPLVEYSATDPRRAREQSGKSAHQKARR